MNDAAVTISVLKPGLFSTIQDQGRFGLRHLGIPWAGSLCPAWQEVANALVGNSGNVPVIECFEGGLQLRAEGGDVLLAVVGSHTAVIKTGSTSGSVDVAANRAVTLCAGDIFQLTSTGDARHAVVAIAGVSVDDHLGSTSTYAKAALGGIGGTNLQTGQALHITQGTRCTSSTPFVEQQCDLPAELRYQNNCLRVIAGPQFDHFSEAGVRTFLDTDYELGVEADRMGVRLQGATIEHRDAKSRDIVSDAIVPGSIQVPGAGLPIVLLNDAHTAGGYPKIATVISSDLPLLGVQRPGAGFRFKLVDMDEAIAASARIRELTEQTIRTFTRCVKLTLDSQTLLALNLIDGVTDGDC